MALPTTGLGALYSILVVFVDPCKQGSFWQRHLHTHT